ncbi:MAG TPA: amino acid permease [Candidatus Thermoplasmatota archaeon]|nr:amino acid permease [Candidatus Thermoplasmatota archaeon]
MPALRRGLGLVEMVAVAVSMMLGIGIFFGPSVTAREFPDAGMVLGLWAVGGAIAIAGAWVFGRLAALYPLSGGPYVYLREAFGPLPAFLFAWTSMVVIGPTGIAVLATLLAANAGFVAPLSGLGLQLLAVWSIAAFAFVNVLGVVAGGRAQTALTLLKLALIAALVVVLFAGSPPAAPAAAFAGGGRLSVAFVGVLFAYGGWEMSALASEEVRDARRTVPRSLLVGAAVVTLVYLAATGSYLAALGADGVARAQALAPEAAARALPGGAGIVAIAVAISAAGTINALTLLVPRATFALARDGLMPSALGALGKRGTPAAAIALQGLLATLYLLTGAFVTIATYDVLAVAVFVVLTSLALPALRRRMSRPVGRAMLAAALGVAAVYVGFVALSLVENTATALVGLALVAAGVVPYAAMRRRFAPARATSSEPS